MQVALAHDYLKEYGGAERVLETLHEIWPEAPLFTAYYNPSMLGDNAKHFEGWDIKTSWFQHFPFAKKLLSPFRIFAPNMFESFDLSPFDLVISSSSAVYFSKAVLTKPSQLHISYIHTPPRYLYGYTTSFDYKKKWYTRLGAMIINHFLRLKDFEVSQRPDILVANSKNVQSRITKFYRRDSVVIYPPVDIERFNKIKKVKGEYFVYLGRLDRGKRVGVIVKAFNALGLPLKVIGVGVEEESLKKEAKKNIQFLGWVKDEEISKVLSKAKALVVAAEDEDFGIISIEAQAAGVPVIAPNKGGFKETVIEGKTGEFFDGSVEDLIKVLEKFDPDKYKAEDCRKNAAAYSKERFKKEVLDLVQSAHAGATRS